VEIRPVIEWQGRKIAQENRLGLLEECMALGRFASCGGRGDQAVVGGIPVAGIIVSAVALSGWMETTSIDVFLDVFIAKRTQ